ncbi:MAG: acyl carrier protein [Chitinophagales bacterium]|nr:MAG: acyl carrier protein [Chitinophagales bacterium]
MKKEELKTELKKNIIKYLNLLEMKPEDIGDNQILFDGSMGLDSIDAFELIVMLEREYQVKITDPREARKILIDVETIADYVIANQPKSTA